MQTDNARSVERQLSMLLSLTAKLLHVVILKRLLNLFMAENNSESVGVDPPPPPHSNTDTPGMVTFLAAAAVRAGECLSFCCWTWTLECLKLKRRPVRLFFGVHIWLRT